MSIAILTSVARVEPEMTRVLDPYFVGGLVRRRFLSGVATCCHQSGVEWEWQARPFGWLTGKVRITLRGPAAGVNEAEASIDAWVRANLGYIGIGG